MTNCHYANKNAQYSNFTSFKSTLNLLIILYIKDQLNKSNQFYFIMFPNNYNQYLLTMQLDPHPKYELVLKTFTWFKDSHSLYDYESGKIAKQSFNFKPDTKTVCMFRNRKDKTQNYKYAEVFALDQRQIDQQKIKNYQLLTKFQIKTLNDKMKISFLNNNYLELKKENEKLVTEQSQEQKSQKLKKDQPYFIVRNLKSNQGSNLGYKLQPGQIIKIGRIQFLVSEVRINKVIKRASQLELEELSTARKVMDLNTQTRFKLKQQSQNAQQQKPQCKICLQDVQEQGDYLFKPCICKGTCGHVHISCLTKWIHFKVRKQVVGGTMHYNFQKFICEVCKHDLPMIIKIDGKQKELLPIQKPFGNYLILEGACQKQKSVIVINNIPTSGINIGRGHQCEIRTMDISISRCHAYIKFINNQFRIFDVKSKFGTLVKQPQMSLQIESKNTQQHIQIGRSILSFQKRNYIQPALKKTIVQRVRFCDRDIV